MYIQSNIKWGKNKSGTILHLKGQLIYFKICRYVYRILSNITWGKNKHEIILQVNTFQNVKVYIHNSNITWGKYKYGIILRSKKHLIYFKACRCTYRIMSNIICGIYKYRSKLHNTFNTF